MAVADSTTRSLEIKLGGVPVSQLDWSVKYKVYKKIGDYCFLNDILEAVGTTNSGTPVTIMPAPAAGLRHELTDFYLVQSNVATTRVILHYNDNGTRYLELDHDLAERDNLRLT